MSDTGAVVTGVAAILCVLIVGAIGGTAYEHIRFQKDAVKAGHAEYATGKDGEPVWQWKNHPTAKGATDEGE